MASQICGLYIGEEHVSALNLRPVKKSWAVVGGATQLLDTDSADALSSTLKHVLRGVRLKDAELEVSLPRRQGLLREVTLPATDPAELAQMAQFEAERHIPFNAERHSTGYHVLSQRGVEGSEVLIAAVDRPFIERCLNAVVSTGVKLRGITLSSLGLFNAIHFARRDSIKDRTVVVASLGLEALDLAIIVKGRLVYGRAADLGLRAVLEGWAGHGTNPGEARLGVDRLLMAAHMIDCEKPAATSGPAEAAALTEWLAAVNRQLSLTHDYARRHMKSPPIDAILLTGEGSLLRNIAGVVSEALHTEAQTVNPVSGLPGIAEQKFPFGGLEFVIPFGTAIAGASKGSYRVDLTPVAHYRRVARQRFMRRLITTSVLAVAAVGLSVASYYRLQEVNARIYAAYRDAADKLDPAYQALHEKQRKTGIIRSYTEDPNAALSVLASLAHSPRIPSVVSLNSVDYKQGREVVLEGTVKTIEDSNNLIQDMRLSGHFEPNIMPSTPEPVQGLPPGQEIYTFSITATLKPSAGAKPASAASTAADATAEDLP